MFKLKSLTVLTFLVLFLTDIYAASTNTVLTQLTRSYRSQLTDHHSSVLSVETGGQFEGQKFYISKYNISGTLPIYRLYRNINPVDHMDSSSPNEGASSGYYLEGALGYAYTSNQVGMAPIIRWYRPSWVDHMTTTEGENPGVLGYSQEGILGYGYPRHGHNCEVPYTISGGGVILTANKAAGGAISELIWNGKQFINNHDYGRQIQTAFNFANVGEYDNPTEAGSSYGCPGQVAAGRAQGSPIEYVTSSGSTLYTRSRPLQWKPENHGGGPDNPVMWDGEITKSVTLNYDDSFAAHVIKWTNTLDIPHDSSNFDWELITAYLTSDFNKLYAYDAENGDPLYDKTTDVENNTCLDDEGENLRPNSGGVIAATSDGSYALGVFRTKAAGYNHFALCKFINGNGGGKYGGDTTKWSVMERNAGAGISAGIYSGTAYLIVGNLTNVVQTMRDMYFAGY